MDYTTAAPPVVDQQIADLETEVWKNREIIERAYNTVHDAAGDRKGYYHGRQFTWKMTRTEAMEGALKALEDGNPVRFLSIGGADKVTQRIAAIETAIDAIDKLEYEIDGLEEIFTARGGWSRFHQLRSTPDARIHSNRWCSGLHRSNHGDLGWHPGLSGKSGEEAVEVLGPVMCSKCFKDAPVEHRRDPKDLRAIDPDTCPGGEERPVEGTSKRFSNYTGVHYYAECTYCEEPQRVRQDGKIGRHKKPKVYEIMAAGEDGTPSVIRAVMVEGSVVKTVRAAEQRYIEKAAELYAIEQGWSRWIRDQERTAATTDMILKALAAKNETSVEVEWERLNAKVVKKATSTYK